MYTHGWEKKNHKKYCWYLKRIEEAKDERMFISCVYLIQPLRERLKRSLRNAWMQNFLKNDFISSN